MNERFSEPSEPVDRFIIIDKMLSSAMQVLYKTLQPLHVLQADFKIVVIALGGPHNLANKRSIVLFTVQKELVSAFETDLTTIGAF